MCCPWQSLVPRGTRGEAQAGCSSSPGLSCSPASASACGVSAAGASRGTTAAHSTRPRSDCWCPPCAGLCSSSEEVAEDAAAATSSCDPAAEELDELDRTDRETQRPRPGWSSLRPRGPAGSGCGSAGSGLGGGCRWRWCEHGIGPEPGCRSAPDWCRCRGLRQTAAGVEPTTLASCGGSDCRHSEGAKRQKDRKEDDVHVSSLLLWRPQRVKSSWCTVVFYSLVKKL